MLKLNDNRIPALFDNVFTGLTNLNELTLSRNEISSITKHSFSGLINLRMLCLESNRLIEIDVGTLPYGIDIYLQGNPALPALEAIRTAVKASPDRVTFMLWGTSQTGEEH